MTSTEKTDLTDSFMYYWRILGDSTEATREHRGIAKHVNKRGKLVMTNHRFDVAFLNERVFIELEGGTQSRGRHVRAYGYHNDCLKYNLAQLQGWLHLRYTKKAMNDDPDSMIKEILHMLKMRRVNPPLKSEVIWTANDSNYSKRFMKQPRKPSTRKAKSRRRKTRS